MRSTPSLPLIPGPPRVAVPVRVPSNGQSELFDQEMFKLLTGPTNDILYLIVSVT